MQHKPARWIKHTGNAEPPPAAALVLVRFCDGIEFESQPRRYAALDVAEHQ